ncbi:MAG: hypothetical protein Q7R70_02420 [Candidatus Diapherotrites archaeon]|nr:hypothetical protein [Candidatus Diapherotrites archaeon]
MTEFKHIAKDVQEDRKVVFTAQSARNFHQRMLICKFAFGQGVVPVNPFNTFGYYLYELVDRNAVRNGNNNLLKRCDELWVFGEISNGVLAEIQMFKKLGKPIKYFDISQLPESIVEIAKEKAIMEEDTEQFKNEL